MLLLFQITYYPYNLKEIVYSPVELAVNDFFRLLLCKFASKIIKNARKI